MMERGEVPNGWKAVQCGACHEFLAIPPDVTEEEWNDLRAAHAVLCRARKGQ